MQLHDGRFLMQDRLGGVRVIVCGARIFFFECERGKKGKETRCNATPCKDAAGFVSGRFFDVASRLKPSNV